MSTKEALSGALNARRLLLKSTAAQMVDRIREGLLVNDYLVLGYQHQLDSDFHRARQYYERALDVARDDVMGQINALRSLGSLCLSATPFHDPEKGDRYFERALELSRHNIDEYSIYTTGHTLESWGWALVGANHPAGLDRVQQAAETYARMSTANPLRDSALAALEHRRALAEAGSSQPIAPTETIGSGALRPTDVAQDRERSRPHG